MRAGYMSQVVFPVSTVQSGGVTKGEEPCWGDGGPEC